MISTTNIEHAKNLIKKSTEKPIIVKAQNLEFNRKILEYGKFDIILSIESTSQREDTPKSIDSGLNHVLGKIASKNNISLGIDLKEIQSLDKKQKAIRISKIIQNIKVAGKTKTKIKLLNFKDKRIAFSFLISLGASTNQASEAVK
ncbi:MAG: hypothetical protein Q7S27_03060 [Nanoarchaeota archaeon]|nr:hypothetical protein [Nanoarchaeota archaeon]